MRVSVSVCACVFVNVFVCLYRVCVGNPRVLLVLISTGLQVIKVLLMFCLSSLCRVKVLCLVCDRFCVYICMFCFSFVLRVTNLDLEVMQARIYCFLPRLCLCKI